MSEHRLGEILIERPRRGMRMSSRRIPGTQKYLFQLTQEATEDGFLSPVRIKVRNRTKYFSDHLGPLKRFLRKQVGQPWDQVYHQLCTKIDTSTLQGQHLLSHVSDFVTVAVEIVDGVVYTKAAPFGGYQPLASQWRERLYVHPETGLLSHLPQLPRSQPPALTQPAIVLKLDDYQEYRQIDEIWYKVTYQDLDPWQLTWDVLLKIHLDSQLAQHHYGRRVYASHKRQCNKRELKAIQALRSQTFHL